MQFNTFVSSHHDLELCKNSGIKEVLIAPEILSRTGKLSLYSTSELAQQAKDIDLKPVLVWDILMTQLKLESVIQKISQWGDIDKFETLRVQDVGALSYILDSFQNINVQWICESASLNLPALKEWQRYIGSRLDRLVLSAQLPFSAIKNIAQELTVSCEMLGAGPILLFYSARPLLRSKFNDVTSNLDDWIYALSNSEESHHREFPTVENTHGTFMYLNKDQFILDRLDTLKEAGIKHIRIDCSNFSTAPNSAEGIDKVINAYKNGNISAKTDWPNPAFAPFFKTNNTTRQFDKLKPQRHGQLQDKYVARVIGSEKPKQLVFQVACAFVPEGEFEMQLPDGEIIKCDQLKFKDLDGSPVEKCLTDKVFITQWIKRASIGALLFKKDSKY